MLHVRVVRHSIAGEKVHRRVLQRQRAAAAASCVGGRAVAAAFADSSQAAARAVDKEGR